MDFEWDEANASQILKNMGSTLSDAVSLFGDPHLVGMGQTVDGEERRLATGMIEDVYVTAVFTMCGPIIRIISMRRARDGERQKHQKIFGGRT